MKTLFALTIHAYLKKALLRASEMLVEPGIFARTVTTQENNNWQR